MLVFFKSLNEVPLLVGIAPIDPKRANYRFISNQVKSVDLQLISNDFERHKSRFYLMKIGSDFYKMHKRRLTGDGLLHLGCSHDRGRTCAPLKVLLRSLVEKEHPNYWNRENWEVIPSSEPVLHKCKPVILQIPKTDNRESETNEPTVAVKIEQDTTPCIDKRVEDYIENRLKPKFPWLQLSEGKLFCKVRNILMLSYSICHKGTTKNGF